MQNKEEFKISDKVSFKIIKKKEIKNDQDDKKINNFLNNKEIQKKD